MRCCVPCPANLAQLATQTLHVPWVAVGLWGAGPIVEGSDQQPSQAFVARCRCSGRGNLRPWCRCRAHSGAMPQRKQLLQKVGIPHLARCAEEGLCSREAVPFFASLSPPRARATTAAFPRAFPVGSQLSHGNGALAAAGGTDRGHRGRAAQARGQPAVPADRQVRCGSLRLAVRACPYSCHAQRRTLSLRRAACAACGKAAPTGTRGRSCSASYKARWVRTLGAPLTMAAIASLAASREMLQG